MRRRFLQYDVFTAKPFGGNPLAIFPDAEGLSDAEMQGLAREMSLSETAFVLPPEAKDADARVRIFTPRKELPFAGHPILGTAWALAERALVLPGADGRIRLEVGMERREALPIEIAREAGRVVSATMTQGEPVLREELAARDVDAVVSALGARDALEPVLPPAISSTGLPWMTVALQSERPLSALRPDFARLEEALARVDAAGAYGFAMVGGGRAEVRARGFCPGLGVPEDPATGSAAGALGWYLAKRGLYAPEGGVRTIRIEQGIELGRPSLLTALVDEPGGRPRVRVRGEAAFVLEGEVRTP